MHKVELRQLLEDSGVKVTNAQLVAAANIKGFEDKEDYSDEESQAILDYYLDGQSQPHGAPHLPTQPPTAEQSSSLMSGLARVADGINSGVDQLLLQRDTYIEDTAHLVAHEIASMPHAIEVRVGELLGEIGVVANAAIVFPTISRASHVLAEPLRRQSLVEKRSLRPADYLMLTASCAPH